LKKKRDEMADLDRRKGGQRGVRTTKKKTMNYYKTNMKRRTRGGSRHKYMLIPKVST
jgi:hypothetical protein